MYAAFHRWLGRGAELEPCGRRGRPGTGRRALAAIPDEVVDALVVHGSFDECRAHVGRYVANGVDIPVMAVIPIGVAWRRPSPAWPRRGRHEAGGCEAV